MKEYQRDISDIYKYIIKESPDNITIDGKYYHYDSTSGAYTGIMDGNYGYYAMSKDIVGHSTFIGEMRQFIENRYPDDKRYPEDKFMSKIVTNISERRGLNDLLDSKRVKFRIWSGQKVFSMWDDYRPQYKKGILESIEGINMDPTEFSFDASVVGPYKTYDEFFIEELTDEEKEEIERKENAVRAGERAMADRLAGANRPSIDLDNGGYPIRQPSWMRREGD